MPSGVAGYANWQRGEAVCRPITDEASAAVVIHELGHLVAGDCPNEEPHRRDTKVTDWWHCIACETEATRIALQLVPCTAAMHERLAQSLKAYRRSTPASPSAIAALDRLTNPLARLEGKQARVRQQHRLEQHAMWKEELAGGGSRTELRCEMAGCRKAATILEEAGARCAVHAFEDRIRSQREQYARMRGR
jgi:hypothetical protein